VNVFFDTEFSDLLAPLLISIGFAAEDGRTLYIELMDWTPAECSHFVREVVLPLLGDPREQKSAVEAAAAIRAWLDDLAPVTLMCDSSLDYQMLGELWYEAGASKPVAIVAAIIYSPSIEGEIAREGLYASDLRRHHALDDAKALLAAWRASP
jgi:hypothetical protein